jgi:hypothetical protein
MTNWIRVYTKDCIVTCLSDCMVQFRTKSEKQECFQKTKPSGKVLVDDFASFWSYLMYIVASRDCQTFHCHVLVGSVSQFL